MNYRFGKKSGSLKEDFQATINCWLKKKASHILVSLTHFDRTKIVNTSITVAFTSFSAFFFLNLEFNSAYILSLKDEGSPKTF